MNWIDLLTNTLRDTKQLKEKYSGSYMLQSAIDQIEYLIDLESGKSTDASKLQTINIGLIAVRAVEDMDMDVADKLHAVAAEVRKMVAANANEPIP